MAPKTVLLLTTLLIAGLWLGATLGAGLWLQSAVLALAGAALSWWGTRSAGDVDQPPAPQPTHQTGFGHELLQNLPAPLLVIATTGRITYVNPAAQDVLPPLSVGTHFSTAIRAPAFVDAISTIGTEREDLSFSFTIVQGGERFFSARASFLPAHSGSAFGDADQIVVLIEDRSQDKALLQTRSDFVANASHELRTPLASILGYIETLQGHAKDDTEAREMFLGIMLAQATRMRRLVDDLMSLSRIEMNAHVQPAERVPLFRIAAEAAAALFPQANASDVLLQIELPQEEGPLVRGDRDQLAQVVVNLVDNAIKYGGQGGKVRIVAAEADARYPRHIGVSVIDQGPGIARENIPRVTERFFRVSPTQSKDLGGTGLGLAITKHILARHRGALDIQSSLGAGSRFTLWVPNAGETRSVKEVAEKTEV